MFTTLFSGHPFRHALMILLFNWCHWLPCPKDMGRDMGRHAPPRWEGKE